MKVVHVAKNENSGAHARAQYIYSVCARMPSNFQGGSREGLDKSASNFRLVKCSYSID